MMPHIQPRPLEDQVILITGATSGIGLVTARTAVRRGARVALVARNEEVLRSLVDELRDSGGQATHTVADVGDLDSVAEAAQAAVDAFGQIDTWVNNAAVSIYGSLVEIPLVEHRRVFETNYWGYVHGCLAAVQHMRDRGGVIINVGSVLSDRAIPRQGPYCASKHAVKGITDSLRMELEEDGIPIAVSLIKPAAIDTPYKQHAKNYFDRAPKNPAPVYAPDAVTEAILSCATKPRRDVIVGGAGAVVSAVGQSLPRLTDVVMEHTMSRLQETDDEPGDRDDHNLFAPGRDGEERGGYPHHVMESSAYTRARLSPVASGLLLLSTAAAGYLLLRRRP